eukprot:1076258-Amphidinium_carterae.1
MFAIIKLHVAWTESLCVYTSAAMSLQWHYRGNRGRGNRGQTPGSSGRWYGGQQAEAPAAAWNRPGEHQGCRLQTAAAAQAQAQAAAPQPEAGPVAVDLVGEEEGFAAHHPAAAHPAAAQAHHPGPARANPMAWRDVVTAGLTILCMTLLWAITYSASEGMLCAQVGRWLRHFLNCYEGNEKCATSARPGVAPEL